MRAVRFDGFGQPLYLADVADPEPEPGGIVVTVAATGLCRSDWHGWQGHDSDITVLPHIPGHEFAGTVAAVGAGVRDVTVGDRVVVPFVCGCGDCPVCRRGHAHVCPHQWQPGVDGPGSFAERVAIPRADGNVVRLPDEVSFEVAAGLGCRFATAYRGLVDVAGLVAGESVAVLGCGGVGLAAVMVAAARGARVVAVDVDPGALELAGQVGADDTLVASGGDGQQTADRIRALVPGGVDVAVDALGSVGTARAAALSLRVRGRHLQIGLLPPAAIGDRATVPMHTVIARELQVLGSHGMPAADYPPMLADIAAGGLDPGRLIARRIGLEQVPDALAAMGTPGATPGVTIISP